MCVRTVTVELKLFLIVTFGVLWFACMGNSNVKLTDDHMVKNALSFQLGSSCFSSVVFTDNAVVHHPSPVDFSVTSHLRCSSGAQYVRIARF